ncbi:MAG: signal peptide peptidase SppA [Thermoguttaceae bacterium]|nr:signal peptide peptidase SppA [Thermoguttaceae bacterium]
MNEENSPFISSGSPDPPYPPFPKGEFPRRFDGAYRPNRRSFWGVFGKILLWCGSLLLICLGGLFLLGVIGFLVSVKGISTDDEIKNTPVEKVLAGTDVSPKKIVVLPIEGTITESEFGFIRNCIKKAYEDDRLSGLVLRVNSPGGTISGSDYYYELLGKLKEERKVPVYVSMGGVAASGGYYVSMVADKIYAERSTITGSIGVISMMFDASSLCEKIGVRSNYIVSGKNKGMGDFTRPMSDDERAIWQSLIDQAYEQFLDVVRRGRPAFALKTEGEPAAADEAAESEAADGAEPEAESDTDAGAELADAGAADPLRGIADGRVYSAADAKRLGLIDEIGFLQDATEAMIKDELKVSQDDVQVVRYRKQESVLSALGAEVGGGEAARQAASLMRSLSTPGLYYMVPGTLPSFD